MQIPLFPITPEDGVPLPETSGRLDIPIARFDSFKTVQVADPQTGKEIEAVIFAFYYNGVEVDRLYTDVDYMINKTAPIGIYCAVHEIAESDQFVYVSVEAISRCFLKRIVLDNTPTVEFDPLEEDLRYESPHLVDTIDRIISDCIDTNILTKSTVDSLTSTSTTETKLNILADVIITEPYDRFKFLVRSDLEGRLSILSRAIRVYKNKKIPTKTKEEKQQTAKKSQKNQPHSFSAEELRRRISRLDLPESASFSVQRELNRLETLNKGSNDYSTTADYLNWIASLPWNQTCHTTTDLTALKASLDASHYGLEDVKQEILEHLALHDHLGYNHGSVLCFLGPPGTGKTTIAQKIAEATQRPYVQISLGGISGESEIRGHRRTYLGSRPGRLIVGVRGAGVSDPLFLLDEIDKMRTGASGDPSSALLEVLDPKQNHSFVDKYLEVPFDLSQAMFICTANDINGIPEALKDRMDIIKFRSYSEEERQIILRRYIIPKAIEDFQMIDWDLQWDEDWLTKLAEKETQLRQIDTRLRKVLRRRILEQRQGLTDFETLTGADPNERSSTSKPMGF